MAREERLPGRAGKREGMLEVGRGRRNRADRRRVETAAKSEKGDRGDSPLHIALCVSSWVYSA